MSEDREVFSDSKEESTNPLTSHDYLAVAKSLRLAQQNGWKVPYEALDLATLSVERVALTKDMKKVGPRFELFGGLQLKGIPVVVKEFSNDVTPERLESFVLDSSARWKWRHPNLVRYFGSYAERFKDDRPFLCLGSVMEDVTCQGDRCFEPLSELLFVQGVKFTLHETLQIVDQVLEATEYIMLDVEDIPSDVARCWCTFSPTNIFLQRNGEELVVVFGPPLHVDGGPLNRYSPHPLASSMLSYGICQLIVTLLTATQPYGRLTSQIELRDTICQREHPVRGFDHAHFHFPPEFKRVVSEGMTLDGKALTSRELQKEIAGLHIVAERYPLHQSVPLAQFTVESITDDYGLVV